MRTHTYICAIPALLCLLFVCSCQQQQQQMSYTSAYHYVEGKTASYKNGYAYAPKEAPIEVKRAIAAANSLVGKPYRHGGGHGKHKDSGYDCSGSTSFTLKEAGLMNPKSSLTSSGFLRWGKAGYGEWITVYTKKGHVFLMIAGLRYDTSGRGRGKGPNWHKDSRACRGFKVRHMPGF